MKKWQHMELSDSDGFGWDGKYMLYARTIDGWNDDNVRGDIETLVTIRMHMDPNTAEREFFVNFQHEKSETNIHLIRLVEIAIDALLTDSRVDLDENVRAKDPFSAPLDAEDEE